MVWDQVIGSALTGLAGVITAWAGLRATRRTQDDTDLRDCETDRLYAEDRLLLAQRHLFALERRIAAAGGEVPPRPELLRG
jgi:hypothetical protein